MPSSSAIRDLLSGRSRGLRASLSRGALSLAEPIYGAAVWCRNQAYERRWLGAFRADVPVVSIGNLTVGGTGKSPLVLWLVQWLRDRGKKPAVLSRGYGGAQNQPNDEALELALRVPDLIHLQAADRARSAKRAIAEFGADVLVLDDGFQHRRLARDLDVVAIDATEPFGFGRLLPRGLLREPIGSLRRAGVVVLTRVDQADEGSLENTRGLVARCAPKAVIAESRFRTIDLIDPSGGLQPLESLNESPVFAFCGIGNPNAFRQSLESIGCRVVGFQSFADHHQYTADDRFRLSSKARAAGAALLVCTLKDLVKWPAGEADFPLCAPRIATDWISGASALESGILAVIR